MTPADTNFLTAATINLYLESLRRDGRLLLAPQDIPILYDMISVITNPFKVTPIPDTARSRELTEEEREQVLATFGQEQANILDGGGIDTPSIYQWKVT
jgi:hypothetical protein